jgi:hypothetical protein
MQSGTLFLDRHSGGFDFRLRRGFKFINRLFNVSVSENLMDNQNYLIKKEEQQNNILYSFYNLDVIEGKVVSINYKLKQSGEFQKDIQVLKDGIWHEIIENIDFTLRCGGWKKDFDSYRLVSKDKFYLEDFFKFNIIKTKDISGIHQTKNFELKIPKNGKFYTLKVKQLKDIFKLNHYVEEITINDFLLKYSKKNFFDGFRYGGVSFGDVKAGQREGQIWFLNRIDREIEIISKDAGKWKIENIYGEDILIVDIYEQKRMIFSNIDKKLYSGKIIEPNVRILHCYNDIAFDAISKKFS